MIKRVYIGHMLAWATATGLTIWMREHGILDGVYRKMAQEIAEALMTSKPKETGS